MKQISSFNIVNFLLLTGYKGEIIQDYFKDGKKHGWKISYSHGPSEWNTGKRIFEAKSFLNKNFILLYSDNYINFNLYNIIQKHFLKNLPITLLLVKKKNGNISLDKKNKITKYDPKRIYKNLNFVELGYMIVNKNCMFKEGFGTRKIKSDFNFTSILEKLASSKKLNNYMIRNNYQSISDIKRLKLAKIFFENKKIIFLDRDGIINHKATETRYVEKWSQFKFIKENVLALQTLAKKGFKFIVITNQAGINLKIISNSTLNYIHKRMKNELKKLGIEILKVYYSPDHFRDVKSFTRKPSPGMFFLASQKYSINLIDCLFIGDDVRDCEASFNAGFNSLFIGEKKNLIRLNKNSYPLQVSKNIKESIPFILEYYRNDYL